MAQLWRFAPVCMKIWKLSAFYSGSLLKHFNRHICHTSNHCLEAGAPLAYFSLFSSNVQLRAYVGIISHHPLPQRANKTLRLTFWRKVQSSSFCSTTTSTTKTATRRCMVQWLWVAVLVFPVQLLLDASAAANKKTFTSFRNVFACQLVS